MGYNFLLNIGRIAYRYCSKYTVHSNFTRRHPFGNASFFTVSLLKATLQPSFLNNSEFPNSCFPLGYYGSYSE